MRKRIARTVIATLLICAALIVPAFAESAVVTGSEVNLRSGPGMNYRIVTSLSQGLAVTVTDRSNSSWYAVTCADGTTGFMSSSYLRLSDSAAASTATIVSDSSSGYINAMYVRFRSGPNSGSSILGEYNKGKAVTITGASGGWTQCVVDGQTGYIYGQYITAGAYTGSGTAAVVVTPDTSAPTSPIVPDSGVSAPQDGSVVIISPANPSDAATTPAAPVSTPAQTQVSVPSDSSDGSIVSIVPAATSTPAASPTPTVAPTAAPAAQSASGTINGDYVRFRTGPGTNYSIINSYDKGKAVTVTGTSGAWTQCMIDGKSGYVYTQYITLAAAAAATPAATPTATPAAPTATPASQTAGGTAAAVTPTAVKDGYINGNNVRLRSEASMSSSILGELFFGNAVKITGTSGDWTAVTYNSQSGYVYSTYVTAGSYSYQSSGNTSELGTQIANFALQYVGYRYCWGGVSPDTGFDCSGLVYYTYQHFGYTLNRVAADQAMNGVHVDPSDLQPGDILCFYSSGSYIGHVGIYIGDGKFVHSSNSTTGVIVTTLAGSYTNRGFEARRII